MTEVKDLNGRVSGLPVDAEHKGTECGPKYACMLREPHMHTFWLSTAAVRTHTRLTRTQHTARAPHLLSHPNPVAPFARSSQDSLQSLILLPGAPAAHAPRTHHSDRHCMCAAHGQCAIVRRSR